MLEALGLDRGLRLGLGGLRLPLQVGRRDPSVWRAWIIHLVLW